MYLHPTAGREGRHSMRFLAVFTLVMLLSASPASALAQARGLDLLPPSSSSATAQAGQPEAEIIVQAPPRDVLRSFVKSLTQFGPTDQIARWKGEICPAVTGIDPAQAEFMIARIAEVGSSVGLRRRSKCSTPMVVIITPDAAGLADEFSRDYPITLRTDGRRRLKAFVNSTSPVRWISVTNECGDACGALPNSRLVKATSATFQAMVIIVDAGKIGGIGLSELSDYVALVALSNPPADDPNSSDSILSMFERRRVEGAVYQLTAYDRSFLSGLYRSARNLDGRTQQRSIESRMKRELGRKPENPE